MTRLGTLTTIVGAALLAISAGAAAQESVLYNFRGSGSSDGSVPECILIMDAAGNLYGTTTSGGGVGAPYDTDGTVFELSPGTGGAWTEKVLYNFGSQTGDGTTPFGGLVFDAQGNLYGTTSLGGANGAGTVYELSPGAGGTWTEKVLYSFGASSTDGNDPRRGSLIFDSKGNLYGTTAYGGTNTVSDGAGVVKAGTVFELSPGAGGVWTEKILYNFGATATDAANSVAGLVMDADGNLYGTTVYGGTANSGTAFELSPGTGGTWTETVLHSFADNGTDGSEPEAALTFDSQGNLYGTTYAGGSNPYSGGLGAVFELSPAGGGQWTEQVIYSFNAVAGVGEYPLGPVIFDTAGNLYGTASAELYGFGQVFKLSPSATGWKETTLYNFGDTPDGYDPANGLVFDTNGNLYGTASTGGTEAADFGLGGTVFEIPGVVTPNPTFTPPAGAFTGTQTVSIADTAPSPAIYYSINGGPYTLYSTSLTVSESETIQAVAISGTVPQSQVATASYQIGTTAASPLFTPPEGTYPDAQSVTITDAAPGATIYYTTSGVPPNTSSTKYTGPITVSATETIEAIAVASGYTNSPVESAIYTITPPIIPTEDVIYNFAGGSGDGSAPFAGLISDSSGNFYGTTKTGGPSGTGTVFKLAPGTGGTWKETLLYTFGTGGTNDGVNPTGGLVFDKSGKLYGTTYSGGTLDDGTVFMLTPATSGPWTETIIHNFDYITNDGVNPQPGLIIDSSGNLYGTTYGGGANSEGASAPGGTVFELSPGTGGTWTEILLHSFNYLDTSDGYYPQGGVVFDSKGNLYGTTSDGGASQDEEGGGTVFELTPTGGNNWTETILRSFGGCAEFCTDGYTPNSGLAVDAAGNVYGTTSAGGPNGFGADGIAFELSPAGGGVWTEKILHNFGANETDGTKPHAGLVFDSNGNLYGSTFAGGANGDGTVFVLSPQTVGSWTESVLHSFNTLGDGSAPAAPLALDAAANLYGTTTAGGTSAQGTVFEIAAVTTVTPQFSLPGGTYAGNQTITLTDATPGATIYYTTNGNTPTNGSTKYTAGISVTATETIKAIAQSSDLPPSAVESATYTIQAAVSASITSPASGSIFPGPNVTFTWGAVSGATAYELYIGNTGAGSNNLYNSGNKTVTSLAVSGLPTAGGTINVRLITSFGGTLLYNDYTYTAATRGALTSPAPGSTLTGPNITFTWSAATGGPISGYRLYLGSTGVGSNNLYNSGVVTGTSFATIALPTNGETIYARLITSFNGTLAYTDYTYTAVTHAELTSPTPGGLLPGKTVTFTWSAAVGGTYYELWLGSTGPGSYNLYDSLRQTVKTITVGGLPNNGETVYARVLTDFNGSWAYADYTFTAVTTPAMSSPTPASVLPGPTVTFTWGGAVGASAYELYLGSTGVGSNNLYSSGSKTVTSLAVTSLPTDGETIYARLLTNFNGSWAYSDYTYTAATHAVLATPAAGSTFSSANPTITISPATGTEATAYELYLGSTGAGSSNLYSSGQSTATSFSPKNLPTNGETIYARVLTNFGGTWGYADYTFVAQ